MKTALTVLGILVLIVVIVIVFCALSPEVGKEINAMMETESSPVEN